jgi:molybdopterin/thiamine biosynthesis adenylyltransferase
MKTVTIKTVPQDLDMMTIYRLLPEENQDSFYKERTDRNIGILTAEDQQSLRNKVVGIAGCGGMGGYVAASLLRLGVGELRLADPEVFDVSNINRQLSATTSTLGKSKAVQTARMLRDIASDTTIVVYPMGIQEEIVSEFVSGCDIIVDEIEFWELSAPIMLHQAARHFNVSILGANTVGFGVHLFKFTSTSMTIEEVFGVTLAEAHGTDLIRKNREMSEDELEELVDKLLLVIAPELENSNPSEYPVIRHRLITEGKASIISTNPLFAAGFLADHVLLELLPQLKHANFPIPEMPGYVYIDARKITSKIVNKKWF